MCKKNRFFVKQIIPIIYNNECEKKLKLKEGTLRNYDSDDIDNYNFEYIKFNKDTKLKHLKEAYDSSVLRMKQFEEKAKTNIIAISISVTITIGLINPISNIYEKYNNIYFGFFLFIISIFIVMFMLYGGIISLKVLMDKNIVYKIGLTELSEDEKSLKNIYGMYGELNEINNTIRNNYINTSYKCMRNALILLSLIFFIGIIPVKLNSEDQTNKNIMELKEKNSKNEMLIKEQGNRLNNIEKSNLELQLKLKELEEKLNADNKK